VPIAAAILFNSIQRPFAKKFYQTSILLPYLMSMVVVSYLTFAFLSADTGYVNKTILPMLGNSESINFYQEKKYWPYILIFVNQWKSLGSVWLYTLPVFLALARISTKRQRLMEPPVETNNLHHSAFS
jgi:putative aldouronate transport system permease protein